MNHSEGLTIHTFFPINSYSIVVRNVLYLFFFYLFVNMVGCDTAKESQEPVTLAGSTMGTSYLVKIGYLSPGISGKNLQTAINTELEKINDQMSTYRPLSEISRFNHSPSHQWFPVSQNTAYVVETALEIHKKTKGAFDITVYPLVKLWGFGPEAKKKKIPSLNEIADLKKISDSRYLEVRSSPPALRKLHQELQIDLSAIAKGFAVDRIAALLKQHGIENFLVEIGGEIKAEGKKKDGSTWLVGVERPSSGKRQIQELIELQNRSLASSGDYRNFYKQEGKRYSHVIDPRTGQPVTHNLASVTVITHECIRADAWATALMVLGAEEGLSLAVDNGLEALFLVRNNEGFTRKTTALFSQQMH